MTILAYIVIALLAFIAYQLYEINEAKKRDFILREREKDEERIRAIMPHVYTKALNEETRQEVERFFYRTERYFDHDIKNPYASNLEQENCPEHKYELMKQAEKDEKDETIKVKMQISLKRISKNAESLMKQIPAKDSTLYERCYILWSYYDAEYKTFPNRTGVFDDILISGLVEIFKK
jgi:hypothetical protein